MFLPYYMAMGDFDYDIQSSDVKYTGNTLEYELDYYTYTGFGANIPDNLGKYTDLELLYRQFVHDNYTDLYDDDTVQFMEKIIAEQGFSPDDPLVIQNVATYIQKAAVYNMDYDKTLDTTDNIAISFLRDYKEGICQHYATAATLLYRALGIPARWTIGYAGNSTANEWVEITTMQAHAWVEVYLDGVGWIYVEVTGGGVGGGGFGDGDGGGDLGGDETDPEVDNLLKLRPIDVVEPYTGEPHFAVPELKVEFGSLLEELLAEGYTYEVEVSGSRVEIGETASDITSFILLDPDGNDVTDQFEIVFEPGLIRVTQDQIIINLYELQKVYNGTELRYGPSDYWHELPDGYEVILDLSACAITDPGELDIKEIEKLPITVLNPDGEDVTNQYYIKFVGRPLRVDKRAITLLAASEDKPFDGTPLTCDSVSILFGQLVNGHKLEAHTTGSITVEGVTKNVIDEKTLRILDEHGNDVTDCYKITCIDGTLEITA